MPVGFVLDIRWVRRDWEFVDFRPTRQAMLAAAGVAFQAGVASYPPETVRIWPWIRTGQLAATAFWKPAGASEIDLFAMEYFPYLALGTGIFGPRGMPFGPVSKPLMTWWNPAESRWIAARQSRGTIWPYYLEKIEEGIIIEMALEFAKAVRLGFRG